MRETNQFNRRNKMKETRIVKESNGYYVEKSDDNIETSISFGFSSTLKGAEKIVSFDDPEINYKYK
jgi:hypothetical protein